MIVVMIIIYENNFRYNIYGDFTDSNASETGSGILKIGFEDCI